MPISILEILKKQKTVLSFKQYSVPRDKLLFLIEAARLAISVDNLQILRFIIVIDKENIKNINNHIALSAFPHSIKNKLPPNYIIFLAPIGTSDIVYIDAGTALQNIAIAALEQGLNLCPIHSFAKNQLSEILEITNKQKILFILGVGVQENFSITEDIELGDYEKYYFTTNDQLKIPKIKSKYLVSWK